MRRPAYMPTPVPTMLAMNAVMIPTGAPSHQPTAPPRLAPRNVSSLDTAPYLLTHPAGRHAAVAVNERDLPDGEDRPAFRRDAVDSEGAHIRRSSVCTARATRRSHRGAPARHCASETNQRRSPEARYPTGVSEAGDPPRATNRRLEPPVPAARPRVRGDLVHRLHDAHLARSIDSPDPR